MIKITDYMSKPVKTIASTDSIRSAAKIMDKHDIGSLVIVDGKKLVGIMTERDVFRKAIAKGLDLDKTPVADIMTKNVKTVTEAATLLEVASLMKENTMRRLVVVNKAGQVSGIVTSKDMIDLMCT